MSVMAQIENRKSRIENSSARLHFVHLPTPGDHYSPATGSAIMTIINGLTRIHQSRGHPTQILVSKGTTVGYPPYPEGELCELDIPPALPSKFGKLMDAGFGRIFHRRPIASRQFSAVAPALTRDFQGTLFVYNAPAPLPALRKRLPKCCLVLYIENQLFNSYAPREIRSIVDASDVLVCCSKFIADDIAVRAGMRSDKIKIVLNGVDTDCFTPAASLSANLAEPPTILFIGRIVPEKGPDLLLKAAVKIASTSRRPFVLRIVGSSNFNPNDPLTPFERHLRTLAEPIKDRVQFIPSLPRAKIPEQYRAAAIFVAPSVFNEPFGLTVAEALASGLPCILSDRGGIPEVAADAALFFAPPDVETLAGHLNNLLENQPLRQKLSECARRRAEFLSWPNRYQSLLEALDIASVAG
jgi:glycosyltransferase involved in cell wall biosynthesis